MARQPTQSDPQHPWLSDLVHGDAIVDTPNGIARPDGVMPHEGTIGAFNEKGEYRPMPNPWSSGNRTGE